MGGASVAVDGYADMIYYNPAGLATADLKEITFMHTVWFEGISYNWLSFVLPQNRGVWGMAVQYVSYGSLFGADNQGNPTGSFSPSDIAVYLSYADYIGRLSYGVNLKYIRSQIIETAQTLALDLGLQYMINYRAQVGFVLQNIGPGLKFNYERDPLPFTIAFGGFYAITDYLFATLDFRIPRDNNAYFAAGAQYFIDVSPDVGIFLRAGLDGSRTDAGGFSSINLGFGLDYRLFNFSYAFAPYGNLGSAHKIGFSLRFGEAR